MATLDRMTMAMRMPRGGMPSAVPVRRVAVAGRPDVRAAWAYAADIVRRHEGDPDAALALTLAVRRCARTPYLRALADALLSAWS